MMYIGPFVHTELASRRRIVNAKPYANITNIKTKLGSYLSVELRPGHRIVTGPIRVCPCVLRLQL